MSRYTEAKHSPGKVARVTRFLPCGSSYLLGVSALSRLEDREERSEVNAQLPDLGLDVQVPGAAAFDSKIGGKK